MKTAIILAGGYGTRLGNVTKDFPKALLEIEKDKPIINYILEKLEKTEIEKVFVVTNNKFIKNLEDWGEKINTKLNIEILNDNTNSNEDRLGAIGDLNFIIEKKQLQEPLIVIGGDNLFDFELNAIIDYFNETKKDLTVLSEEKNIEILKQMNSITLDENNKITFFEEKPENPSSTWFGICIYLYTKETVSLIKQYLEENNNPDQTGRFLQWLYKKKEVYGYKTTEPWFDIGTPEILEEAKKHKQKPL